VIFAGAVLNLSHYDLSVIAQASAARIVDCLLEGTLIAGFAALMLRITHRQSAGARFAVWFAALMAIAILPLAGTASWSRAAGMAAGASASPAEITLPDSWALYLLAAWAAIAVLALARVAAGLVHLHRLRSSCVPVDPQRLDPALRSPLDHARAGRTATLCVSDRVAVPTALGFFKPLVIIPRWLMQELSPADLNQILLHELAHLRRWDDWTNLLQKIVRALFFFHPAVWWIEQKISLEREMACDDAVLAQTASPRAYAECLAHLAEKSFVRRSVALAQAALGRVRQTSLRIAQILDHNRPAHTRRGWSVAVLSIAAFAAGCAVCISKAPKLVAFEDAAPAVAATAASFSPPAIEASLRVVPAVLPVAEPPMGRLRPASRPAARSTTQAAARTPVRATEQARPAERSERGREVAGVRNSPLAGANASSALHLAGLKVGSQATTTEAVFVVVEGPADGSPGYQVTVWRFTVLRTSEGALIHLTGDGSVVAPSSGKIPRKQT